MWESIAKEKKKIKKHYQPIHSQISYVSLVYESKGQSTRAKD